MATIQKTTLKRYNGTDWDPVYLANSADISYLGTGFTVTKEPASVYTNGTAIAGTTAIATMIPMIVNNLAKINEVDIPGLADGSSITSLNLDNVTLTGEVPRENLPEDVSGKAVKVATEDAKAALTKDNVNVGDIVNVAGGKLYMVTGFTGNTPNYLELTDAASDVVWSRITGTPTTLAGYGITDAVNSNEKVTEASAANAGKILVLNANGKLDADITGDANTLDGHDSAYFAVAQDLTDLETVIGEKGTGEAGTGGSGLAKDIGILETKISTIDASWITRGTINIDRLPHGALERCVVVADQAARFALTTAQVQSGDTVKQNDTGVMYFVVDDTQLNVAAGYEEYTAGAATSVPWSGVQKTPTTLAGYGITDAVNSSEKVTAANAGNAGKILVLNSQGKLDVDITGHVDWANINDKPTSTVAQIDAAVATATHTNRAVLDELNAKTTNGTEYLTYKNSEVAYLSEVQQVALGALQIVSTVPADAQNGQFILETIAG